MPPKKIIISCGGTGGHLFPAQVLAEDLSEYQVSFLGHGLEDSPYFERNDHQYREIPSARINRKKFFRSLLTIAKGIWKSYRILKKESPDVVVGFGSYHGFPSVIAAKLCRIPIILFESNATPGQVNRLTSRFASLSTVYIPSSNDLATYGKLN